MSFKGKRGKENIVLDLLDMLTDQFIIRPINGEIDFDSVKLTDLDGWVICSNRGRGDRRAGVKLSSAKPKSMVNIAKDTIFTKHLYLLIILFLLVSCNNKPHGVITSLEKKAALEPDYSDVTIPPNIAPLNFLIKEKGSAYFVSISSGNGTEIEIYSRTGIIRISKNKWHKMLKNNIGKEFKVDIYTMNDQGQWSKFGTVINRIASEPIDPYLYYRLLYPGAGTWAELSIIRRDLENFREESLIENTVADKNCINCHSFNNGKTDNFLFHMRGSMGGTYFYSRGEFKKINLKTDEMKNGAVYPGWHPSGKFVAFSSNKVIQRFHAADKNKVEVSDLESSLVLYDVEKNEIMNIESAEGNKFMDTYPEWSPDGRYLYFCRTDQIGEQYDYQKIRYNLYSISFDPDKRIFGEVKLVFDAAQNNKSIAFPKISPNGRFLVMTVFDFGCFPIWHKEADLYSIDLQNFTFTRLDLNSDFSDSYHSWSSNGKWLVFSSKRGDGLTARPYISYIEENGVSTKPFILPQEDPEFYDRYLKSFNVPEFSTIKIDLNPGETERLSKTEATQAKWYTN